ncbi:MAG: hypothetical protein GY862_17170, partial [Gammaproteobacteria bacterium]|nr:hypothetical protein [Gammaproteobacteria bacterium]
MSIEQTKAQAIRLMAETSKLQARTNAENLRHKAETDKLIREINKLQIAAIKNRDQEKAKLAKAKTKKLFGEQLAYAGLKQRNLRDQTNRLIQSSRNYERDLGEIGAQKVKPENVRVQQQLLLLIKKKKEEFVRLNKEADVIRQRARQKGISLTAAKQKQKKPAQPDASTKDRAQAEAEKLIEEVTRGQANAPGGGDIAEKAEEAGKLIAEITELQTAADKGLLSEDEVQQLEERVARLEGKQKRARNQINQLTQAKIKYELALAKSSEEKSQEQQRKTDQQKIQTELNTLIQQKEDEQRQLMTELDAIRLHSEQETAILKAQRDAARVLAEQQAIENEQARPEKSRRGLLIGIAAVVLALAGAGVFFMTPLFDDLMKSLEEAPTAVPPVTKKTDKQTPPPTTDTEDTPKPPVKQPPQKPPVTARIAP